jgi:hypothetical protein
MELTEGARYVFSVAAIAMAVVCLGVGLLTLAGRGGRQ